MLGHRQRVGTQAWNSHMLASGSRDKTILLRDVRVAEAYSEKFTGHRSEVCGLKVRFALMLQCSCSELVPQKLPVLLLFQQNI